MSSSFGLLKEELRIAFTDSIKRSDEFNEYAESDGVSFISPSPSVARFIEAASSSISLRVAHMTDVKSCNTKNPPIITTMQ